MTSPSRRHKLTTRNDTRDIIFYGVLWLVIAGTAILINNWVTERVML